MVARGRGERNPQTLLEGMLISAATIEINVEVPEKPETRTTFTPAIPHLGMYLECNLNTRHNCTPIYHSIVPDSQDMTSA
jgi:hypothetical protein